MFNMLMLAIIDVMNFRHRVLRKIAVSHALTAAFAILLAVCAVFFIQGKLDFGIGWFGADSLILIGLYIFGAQVIHEYNSRLSPTAPPKPEDFNDNLPTLRRALIGFGAATAVLIIITPIMVSSANDIAELTGISAGFIGVALVSVITSLPELVTTIAAARIGAFDLAVGNLFGSNVFNVMALGLTDAFYTKGFLLTDLNPDLAISGMFGWCMPWGCSCCTNAA
jgi:cation:H+ antiporter